MLIVELMLGLCWTMIVGRNMTAE